MSGWELAGAVAGTLCFIVWLACVASWIRRGVSIPRYLHLLAVVLTCVGACCLVGLAVAGIATPKLAILLLAVPPAITYFGWFWMFGPDLSR